MKRMRTMWVLAMVVGPFMATASMAQTPTIEKIELLGLNRQFSTAGAIPKLHSNGERTALTEGARIPIGDYAVEVTFADNDGLDKIATVQFRWHHDSLHEAVSYHETVGYPDNNRGRPDMASSDPKGTPPALTSLSLLGCGFEVHSNTLNIKYYHRCLSLANEPAGRSGEPMKLEITWVLWAGGARQAAKTVNFRMVRAGATALDTDGATDNDGTENADNEGDDNADNEADDNADNEADDNADNEGDDNADNEADDNADNEADDNEGDDNEGDDNDGDDNEGDDNDGDDNEGDDNDGDDNDGDGTGDGTGGSTGGSTGGGGGGGGGTGTGGGGGGTGGGGGDGRDSGGADEPACTTRVAPYWSRTGGIVVMPTNGRSVDLTLSCDGRTMEDTLYARDDGLIVQLLGESRVCTSAGALSFEGAEPGGWYWMHGDRNAAVSRLVCEDSEPMHMALDPGGVTLARSRGATFVSHDTSRLIAILPDTSGTCTERYAPRWRGPGGLVARPADGETVALAVRCTMFVPTQTFALYPDSDGIVRKLFEEPLCVGMDGNAYAARSVSITGAEPGAWYWVRDERNAAGSPFMCESELGGPEAHDPGGVDAASGDHGTLFKHHTQRLIGIVPHVD